MCLTWRPVRRPLAPHFVSIARTDDDQLSDAAHGRQAEHRWWILAVLATAQLMVALDATVVSTNLPRAQATLHFSSADRQWIITASP
jgi:hypothetical protein